MKIDAVFSGGGVKAFSFVGVLSSLDDAGFNIERVAGTSAGAIIASLVAAHFNTDEIIKVMEELEPKELLDPPKLTEFIPFSKWLFLYFRLGINKGDKLEKWLYDLLAEKDIYTFSDIKEGYLKVVVSDLTLGKLVVIPDDLDRIYGIDPKYFPISKAVRMSAGFPYFFMPKKMPGKSNGKSIIVDGGLLSNFPLWLFSNGDKKEKRPILGVKSSSSYEQLNQPGRIHNAFDMFTALFSTMKQAHDARYISKAAESHIIFLPVEEIDTVDFNINKEKKDELFKIGKERADNFLRKWPI